MVTSSFLQKIITRTTTKILMAREGMLKCLIIFHWFNSYKLSLVLKINLILPLFLQYANLLCYTSFTTLLFVVFLWVTFLISVCMEAFFPYHFHPRFIAGVLYHTHPFHFSYFFQFLFFFVVDISIIWDKQHRIYHYFTFIKESNTVIGKSIPISCIYIHW